MNRSETIGKLVAAIAKCSTEIGSVSKDGYNKAQGYAFVGDEHIMAKAQSALADNGLCIAPSTMEHASVPNLKGTQAICTVCVTWLVSHVSGEWFTIQTVGEGADPADKGAYKAMTGARKYAFRLLFNIPTGDDAEKDDGPAQRQQIAPAQQPQQAQQAADPETEARRNVFTFVSNKVGAGIAGTGTTFHTFCRSAPVDKVRAFGNKFREINVGSMQAQDAFLQCVAEFVTAP
jgi:hypothetical protein